MVNRRQFVANGILIGVSGLAGCTNNDASEQRRENEDTPTETETRVEEPESEETVTENDTDLPIEAIITEVENDDRLDRDELYVEAEIRNTHSERLAATWVSYSSNEGMVFNIGPDETREIRIYDRSVRSAQTEEGEKLQIREDFTWYPGDYPRTFTDAEVTAEPAFRKDGDWWYRVENPTEIALDDIDTVSVSASHPTFDGGYGMDGTVRDGALLLEHNGGVPRPGRWEFDWTVELTGTTSQTEFSVAIPPARPRSNQSTSMSGRRTDATTRT
ncbi:hypothetical protein ACFQER_05385 [Halomicroarcula sp. GCM10025894]|uniref:hypothetical protein n=1 Tax=Halomicroarcula sp. GCM10025894 TaxID=3252673 RepID=UPI00361CFB78